MTWQAEWDAVASMAWKIAEDHGFHDERPFAASAALMHSEISEAVEADRHGNPDSEKIPGFKHIEEELADLVIRVMDESVHGGHDVGGAVLAKMEYNKGRPYKHGKAY